MSEATAEQTSDAARKPIPAWLKWVIAVVILLIVFLIQDCSGRYRTLEGQKQMLARGVEALAASLTESLLDNEPVKTDRLAVQIAEAGKYEVVTIADRTGEVIASTDQRLENKPFEGFDTAGESANVRQLDDGRLEATAGIYLAEGNRFGAVRVIAPLSLD